MEKNDDDVIIKFEELNKVIPECIDHISGLLKTAKHLHDNNSYEHSIMMNILAFEELNKLAVFCDHQRNFKGVTRKTMDDLTKHKYKLDKIIDLNKQREEQLAIYFENSDNHEDLENSKENIEILDELRLHYPNLNFIKQMIMYYDFREGNTIILKNYVTKNNLKHGKIPILLLMN